MAAETAYSDASDAAGSSGGMAQLDLSTWASQIFWLVITFAVLYFVLSKFILPKIDEGLTNRGDRIADDLEEAARMTQEAQQAELDYEQSMADAKAKAHNISETTRKSVEAEIEADIAKAEEEFARKQSEADTRIAKVKAAGLAKVDEVALDTVSAILDKVAGLKVPASAVKSAVSNVKG
ncbi:F0F1 ATP synthase subunit B' [Fretibacter rubidus]|uniref:F0F1 ATP synthase subunit B family protein n=1 Tax=Fretibacter rubidus TaxID=570162 RepID=UPI00352ADB05